MEVLRQGLAMARPLRIERAGAWYHLTGRGIERRLIYTDDRTDDRDRRRWLALLAEAASSFRWRVCGYVLMDNHWRCVKKPET